MKFDLALASPLMNAAGSLGFYPDVRGPVDLSALGAFVTNPLSLQPRTPAGGERFLPAAASFLLHTGYPNPGLRAALRQFARRWRRSDMPVIVHLLVQSPDEAAAGVRRLEAVEGVLGVELGLPPDIEPNEAPAFLEAALGELPLIVRLPFEQAGALARALASSGLPLTAASLAPPRGLLPGRQEELVRGRLYGPAMFPLALAALRTVAEAGLPAIGAGGVYTTEQVQTMLNAGALAVQVDGILWRGREK